MWLEEVDTSGDVKDLNYFLELRMTRLCLDLLREFRAGCER